MTGGEERYRKLIYDHYRSSSQTVNVNISSLLKRRKIYLVNLINKYFPADKSSQILDLGCGYGALLHVAGKMGYVNCRGVDISPEMVALAQKLSVDIIQEDIFKALEEEADESLDFVISIDVIEHLTKNELVSFAMLVKQKLRNSGKWLIHCPNAESPFGAHIRYSDYTHEQAFTRISINQLFKSIGFSKVLSFEDKPIPKNLKGIIRALGWSAIRLFWRMYLAIETGDGGSHRIFSQNFISVAYK